MRMSDWSSDVFSSDLYAASRRIVPMTVHAPENAAEVKLEVMRSLGASVVIHPFGEWWDIMCARSARPGEGLFVHPVCQPGVIVGNGTEARRAGKECVSQCRIGWAHDH